VAEAYFTHAGLKPYPAFFCSVFAMRGKSCTQLLWTTVLTMSFQYR
jgi:hypothetical protein